MSNKINIEIHPEWYYDIPVMKTLILGSFPPHIKRHAYSFYYPHKRNHFWKILAEIAKVNLQHFEGEAAVIERKQLMKKLQVGVENVGKIIERQGESAMDTKIEIKDYRDILGIIKKHHEIKRILLPGFHARNSTTQSFLRYLDRENIKFERPGILKPETAFNVFIEGREIECIILNSTSPAYQRTYQPLMPQFEKALNPSKI